MDYRQPYRFRSRTSGAERGQLRVAEWSQRLTRVRPHPEPHHVHNIRLAAQAAASSSELEHDGLVEEAAQGLTAMEQLGLKIQPNQVDLSKCLGVQERNLHRTIPLTPLNFAGMRLS